MSVYNFTALDVPSATGGTSAYGINRAGLIVGGYAITSGTPPSSQGYGFLYNPQDGTYTTLNAGPFTSAQGSNDTGWTVGYYGVGSNHGFLYGFGTYTTLDVPGATRTQAYGINTGIGNFPFPGQISGSYSVGSTNHGFVYSYSSGTYTTLDEPLAGPGGTFAYGINSAGEVVGTAAAQPTH